MAADVVLVEEVDVWVVEDSGVDVVIEDDKEAYLAPSDGEVDEEVETAVEVEDVWVEELETVARVEVV